MSIEIFKNKKLVIYGTGERCKDFIAKYSNDLIIVGIIDRFRVDGEFKNIPIITWNDVIDLGADYIIIASAECWYREIYERIFHKCLNIGLRIFTQYGQDLMQYYGNPCESFTAQMIKDSCFELIDKYDVISFDIFDTLLIRSVLYPRDIFLYVENYLKSAGVNIENFYKIRVECELNTKGRKLDDIYETIKNKLHCNDETISRIKSIEIDTEKKFLNARLNVVELYNYAKNKKKKVILVSDMYLPKNVMEELLEINGITNYDKLYISCEEDAGKADGLFDIVKHDYEEKSIVHFGDNDYLDGECPRYSGICSFVIPKTIDYFMSTKLKNSINFAKTINDEMILGKIISNNFSDRNNLKINSLEEIADIFCVPFAILYLDRIVKMVRNKNYRGILFPARDGFIIKKIYDQIAPFLGVEKETFYIPSSRKLMVRTGIINDEDLRYSYKYANLVNEPIKNLYGISKDEIIEDNVENIERYKELIMKRSSYAKERYKKYLSNVRIDTDDEYLLCELNGQGTTQYYLKRFFKKHLDTVYLVRWHNGDTMESTAVFDFWKGEERHSCLNYRFDILESFFSAPHPSIIDLSDDLEPLYAKEDRSNKQIEAMAIMQEYAEKRIIDFFKNYYVIDEEITPDVGEQLLRVYEDCSFGGKAASILFNKYYDDLSEGYVRIL